MQGEEAVIQATRQAWNVSNITVHCVKAVVQAEER